jgi:hypothetical protein
MVVAVVAALMLPTAALADNSVLGGYGGAASTPVIKVGNSGTEVQVQGATESKPATSGTLPFTGADLVWFVLAGGALLIVGAGLRKFGSERN